MISFAERMGGIKASDIRQLLAVASKPEIISFAGGLPAPELFPFQGRKDWASPARRQKAPEQAKQCSLPRTGTEQKSKQAIKYVSSGTSTIYNIYCIVTRTQEKRKGRSPKGAGVAKAISGNPNYEQEKAPTFVEAYVGVTYFHS